MNAGAGWLWRRALDGVLVLLGVNLLTFVLFFTLNTPDDMARINLGGKHVTPQQVAQWKAARGYDKPLYWNRDAHGWRRCTDTVFWECSVSLLAFDFGRPDGENAGDIGRDVAERIGVSLQLALPLLVLQVVTGVGLGLLLVLAHGTAIARWSTLACLLLLSVSGLFYLIAGQAVCSRWLHLAPVSGHAPGLEAVRFLVLPVALAALSRLGSDGRLYRAVLLEEYARDHVRAARAKGLGEWQVLWRHVLPNAGVPILAVIGADLPYVVLGTVVVEAVFGLPGMGAYAVDAVAGQDFAVVRSMVFVGALVQIAAFWLIDAAQALADPRLRLGDPAPGGGR